MAKNNRYGTGMFIRKIFLDILGGDWNAAIFLSQAIYWSETLPEERDGWFFKSTQEWSKELYLTERQIVPAREKLRALGILQEKKEGIPYRLWFKIDHDALDNLVCLYQQNVGASSQQNVGTSSQQNVGTVINITENTSDILTERNSKSIFNENKNAYENVRDVLPVEGHTILKELKDFYTESGFLPFVKTILLPEKDRPMFYKAICDGYTAWALIGNLKTRRDYGLKNFKQAFDGAIATVLQVDVSKIELIDPFGDV